MDLPETDAKVPTFFPGLASLGLSWQAWDALAKQGSLCAESSANEHVFKLRFRMDGRQHSRCVGKEEGFIQQIRRELTQLQADARRQKQLRRLVREAKQCIRKTKHQLAPLLSATGHAFHGMAIRRQRRSHIGTNAKVIR